VAGLNAAGYYGHGIAVYFLCFLPELCLGLEVLKEEVMNAQGGFKSFVGMLVLVVVVMLCGPVSAAEFSADVMHKAAGRDMPGKVYVKGDLMRSETMGTITIMDMKKKMTWVIMPEQKIYMEVKKSGIAAGQAYNDEELAKIADKKHLGTETVNGHKCDKYLITYHDTSMGSMTQWVSQKLKYPIKYYFSKDGMEVESELKNIKEGSVDDSLFEIPAGYQKMDMPMMNRGRQGMK